MKLSVFYPHILDAVNQTGYTIDHILSLIREYGISAVEIDAPHLAPEEKHLSALNQAGLEISCVNCFYALDKTMDVETVRSHISYCRNSGSSKMLIVPGFLDQDSSQHLASVLHDPTLTDEFMSANESVSAMVHNLRKIVELTSSQGIQVVLEDFDNIHSPISGLYGLLWFMKNVPGIHCCFDTGNFITHNEDPLFAWEILKPYVLHIHCKDRSNSPIAVGYGTLPIKEIIKNAIESGYSGTLAIEHYGAEDQLLSIRNSADFLLSIL